MPFENWGLTTMSTDFRQSVFGEEWIRSFSLYKEGEGEPAAEGVPVDEQTQV